MVLVPDTVIYTSEVIKQSNNPIFKALEDEDIMDKRRKWPGRLVIRMWTRSQEATEFCPLLEWRMELCCLRYIGQELRDIPGSFPDNTIILGLEDGFYTAPDDDDMPEHPHLAPPPIFDPLDRLQYSVKRSYNYESVMRLNNLHECIADTEESRDEIKQNIEASLKSANTQLLLQKIKGERTERLWHLQRQIGHELNMLDQVQDRVEYLKKRNAERREALSAARERGRTRETYLIESYGNLEKNRESHEETIQELAAKRKDHLSVLYSVYPITESENDPSTLRILNVPLPNSSFYGIEEETVAVSLGFTCHLVTMLAYYLNVPLRYPLIPMGCRSTVLDPISMLLGSKDRFPLYSKGQDRQRFEYGVFLLNKDIEQLLNSQGLQFLDLRQTLPNIRYLLETLLASSPVSKSKARQRQEDTFYNRHSLEESNAAETDDELGAPSLRVQSPDNSMGKPRIDFADSRTPSSTTDASLSAKSSRSQSSSQLERQMDAADDEDYELVNEVAQLSSNRQGRSWQVPQLPGRFFSEITDDASRSRAFRLHRASTDFSALKSYRRLDDDEDYVPVLSRRRHTTWSSHDARLVAYYSNLFVDQQEERTMQGLPILNDGEKGGRSEGRGQTSDSSESTAHEVGQAQHNSLSSLTPAPSTKVIDDEIATSLYATRSTSTRV
ncbi:hypothetical protein BGW42_002952 [Actinomortierella wolfii]|nr:hypothetical protein BGW42_002952 [Actinomortierella wolfii]